MKYKCTSILLAFSSCCFAESIEIHDAGIAKFESGKATFVGVEKIPGSDFYFGCRLDAQKEDAGGISVRVANVAFLGFVELEPGKLSPITKSEEKKISIPKQSDSWTEIEISESQKLSVRWKE